MAGQTRESTSAPLAKVGAGGLRLRWRNTGTRLVKKEADRVFICFVFAILPINRWFPMWELDFRGVGRAPKFLSGIIHLLPHSSDQLEM